MKPLPKLNPKSLSLVLMLKADDEVIAVADDDDITARVTTPPLLSPEVKDVVEVDVREHTLPVFPAHPNETRSAAPDKRPWKSDGDPRRRLQRMVSHRSTKLP